MAHSSSSSSFPKSISVSSSFLSSSWSLISESLSGASLPQRSRVAAAAAAGDANVGVGAASLPLGDLCRWLLRSVRRIVHTAASSGIMIVRPAAAAAAYAFLPATTSLAATATATAASSAASASASSSSSSWVVTLLTRTTTTTAPLASSDTKTSASSSFVPAHFGGGGRQRGCATPSLVVSSSPASASSSSWARHFSSSSMSSLPSSNESDNGPGRIDDEGGSSTSTSSQRGKNAPSLLPTYLTDARAAVRYHPTTAPNGALQLSVAENQLVEKAILPALRSFAIGASKSDGLVSEPNSVSDVSVDPLFLFQSDQIYYQPTHGRPALRHAAARYLERVLRLHQHQYHHDDNDDDDRNMHGTNGSGRRRRRRRRRNQLDVDGLVLGAGCNAVLENLCFCLAEFGDSVMIPVPYYAAFEFDLTARIGLNIVPVETMAYSGVNVHVSLDPNHGDDNVPKIIPPEAYYPTRSALDAAYNRAVQNGGNKGRPRILLLSHPNNPLGICYPPSVVKACIDWCRERHVHLVSDEIYAGSVHGGTSLHEPFVSALSLAAEYHDDMDNDDNDDDDNDNSSSDVVGLGLGPYVHFVYALSKDFGLSGLRVGIAYSENADIRLPMQKLNDLCQISSQTQVLVERMLSAPSLSTSSSSSESLWSTDTFLPENKQRIRKRCIRLEMCLRDECQVPYLPADSGLFVWIDLREFLPLPSLFPMTESYDDDDDDDDNDGIKHEIRNDGNHNKEDQQRRCRRKAMWLEQQQKRERNLYLSLLHDYGLLFTPGLSMKNELPGFFRCVFTAASDEEFDLALKRLVLCVSDMRLKMKKKKEMLEEKQKQ